MRGRIQAILVTVVGILLPFFAWISVAAVGLVTLRRGGADGGWVAGWGVLTAIGIFMLLGDAGAAATLAVVLAGTVVAAQVLRWSVSWPYALTAAAVVGLITASLLLTVGSDYVARLAEFFNQMLEELRRQMPQERRAALVPLTPAWVSGQLGFFSACAIVAGLLLARWWQAMLYNPGGFREEFHRLRLPLPLALTLVAASALMLLPGPEYRNWSPIFTVPFVVAGFALVHGVAGIKGWGRGRLVLLYVAWLLLGGVVTVALMLLALLDSGWDFRGRLRAGRP
jgi:hypothetical protein